MEEKNKKKTKNRGKRLVARILFYSMINWSLPVAISAVLSFYVPSRKVEQQSIEKYKSLPKDFTAIDYLNLSNMIVHHKGKGEGDCKDYAIETFKTYKKLIKNNNREGLEAKIKVACGNYGGEFLNKGHVWIKIKHKGKWLDYESTEFVSLLNAKEIRMLSNYILEYKQELPSEDEPLVGLLETFEGKKIFRPKIKAFKNWGIVGAVYHRLTSDKK